MEKKHLIRLLALFLFTFQLTTVIAQGPDQFKYQAVLRDASGTIIANQQKDVVITILQGSETGQTVFSETHNVVTTAQGIINLNIGSVNSTGIAAINWNNSTYYIRISVGGVVMGTSQLVSVPYALNAKTVSTFDYLNLTNKPILFSGNYNDLTNKPILFNGTWASLTGKPTTVAGYGITDAFIGTWSSLTGKPVFSTVATSGNYMDLSNTPKGTNIGDIQYWNGSDWVNVLSGLPGQFLQLNQSNIPTWVGPKFSTITTSTVSSITITAAIAGGIITNDGGATALSRGVCWSTSPNPTILNSKSTDGTGTGSFTSNLSGLTAGTTYYIRSYATSTVGTAYGNEVNFKTQDLQNVPSYVPTTGLVGWWPFNGNANDESGNGNNGTVNGAILSTDRYGNLESSFGFNGLTSKIEVSDNPILKFASSNKISISTWFKMLPPASGTGAVFFSKQSGVGNLQQGINGGLLNGNQNIVGIIKNGSAGAQSVLSTPSSQYVNNIWHHWVYTFDNGAASIYLDNTLITTNTTAGSIIGDNVQNLIFGTGNTGNVVYFKGQLDDIGIWNRVLSQQEIANLYNSDGPIPIETVTDIDGNVYKTVTIGTQIWMAENLKTNKYRDGTAIPNVTNATSWTSLTTGAYCWYNNDAATYKNTYGGLYNWYTVNTGKLAPKGWHIPTLDEWNTLKNYLGGESGLENKLKSTTGWDISIGNGLNSSGFNAFPCGYIDVGGKFMYITKTAIFWSSTIIDIQYSRSAIIGVKGGTSFIGIDNKIGGFSIRCLKD